MLKYPHWPVAIGIIYGAFVLTLIGFLIFSSFNTVDLVSNDYYKQELVYQEQIDRIKRSKSLTRPLTWDYDRKGEIITIQFPDSFTSDKIHGKIHFFRPSDSSQDIFEYIRADSRNQQRISTKDMGQGLWRLKIIWEYQITEYYDESIVFIR